WARHAGRHRVAPEGLDDGAPGEPHESHGYAAEFSRADSVAAADGACAGARWNEAHARSDVGRWPFGAAQAKRLRARGSDTVDPRSRGHCNRSDLTPCPGKRSWVARPA